ncbi:MAG: hypothetical protein QHH75_04655 [Bacillota bacterium]|nr:hypothetical protein [Bacillota bacterium]
MPSSISQRMRPERYMKSPGVPAGLIPPRILARSLSPTVTAPLTAIVWE